MARRPQPVRPPRPHDPRDLGLRAAWHRDPPGARDVERVEPATAHPRRRPAPSDCAPALRGQRHLPGTLRAPRQSVARVRHSQLDDSTNAKLHTALETATRRSRALINGHPEAMKVFLALPMAALSPGIYE